jgi:hypothetical protein
LARPAATRAIRVVENFILTVGELRKLVYRKVRELKGFENDSPRLDSERECGDDREKQGRRMPFISFESGIDSP